MSNSTTIQPTNRYEGAGRGRRLASWNTPSSGPVASTSPAIATLRNRARDLVRNDAVAASAVRVLVNSIVGFGINSRSNSQQPDQKLRINQAWKKWTKHASRCGGDFYSLQAVITRALVTDGEVFVRLRTRIKRDGIDTPLQLEALESDMLPMLTTEQHPGLTKGHRITQGIEFDAENDICAYWFHTRHPGESHDAFTPATDYIRIEADAVLHIFEPQRPGQLRGVTPFSSVITTIKNLGDFSDTVLERMKLSNLFVGFLKTPLPDQKADAMTGLPFSGDPSEPLAALEPGLMQTLLPGESVEWSTPPDAGANYADYVRTQHLTIGAALGVPPEMLTGELRDISDRTLRFAVGEFRRRVEQIMWTVLVPRFLNPVRAAFAKSAILSGALPVSDFDAIGDCTWSMHAQSPVHALQDMNTNRIAVEQGFKSRAQIIAEMGESPDEVDAERAEDLKRSVDLGLQSLADQKTAVEIEQQQFNIDQGNAASLKASAALDAIAAESQQSVEILQALIDKKPELAQIRDAKTETLPSIMRGFLGKK